MVQHRADLDLSDDQVRQLELLDLEREKEDTAIRDQVEQKRQQAHDANATPTGGGAPSGGRAGGMGGSGMRGGGMRGGGMHGGGMGGRGQRGPGGGAPSAPDPGTSVQAVQDRMDANDTKAYLDGEALLEEQQREKAREIASDFREKLYERRELLRARGATK